LILKKYGCSSGQAYPSRAFIHAFNESICDWRSSETGVDDHKEFTMKRADKMIEITYLLFGMIMLITGSAFSIIKALTYISFVPWADSAFAYPNEEML
jgi:hypothetical protein